MDSQINRPGQGTETLANRLSSGMRFEQMLPQLLNQNGYTSDNTKKGVQTALRDYKAVFHKDEPDWLKLVWPSVAMSVLHLAISCKTELPQATDLPMTALKS